MIKILTFLLLITTVSSIPFFFPVITRAHITTKKVEVPVPAPVPVPVPAPSQMEQFEQSNNNHYCSICDFIIHRSEEFITNITTYEDALHIMKMSCNHLPKMKYTTCNEIISENSERMISMIAKKEDASIICSNLHICDNVGMNISDCFFCHYASKRIEYFLNENHTIHDIIDYGEHFCEHIRFPYQEICVRIMEISYLDLIGKIIDRHNPIDACEAVRLCLR